ncbi:MAG TPA: sterol-binding protein [Sedimenticola sp.]|nr:sterol-binding protein [Sedimenticola sp.]
MSLSELAWAGLEATVNRLLALDPVARKQLAEMHGRVIAFEVLGTGQTLYLVPGPARLQILSRYEGEPDCLLRGTPLALARMGRGDQGTDQLFSGEVEIRGDTGLAHRFGHIMGSLDIDWEEQLSRVTGDVVAHGAGELVRGLGRWGRDTLETFGLDLQEYLQEELRLLPQRLEIETFLSQVDRLRDDVERLEARVERLRSRRAGQ